MSVLELVTTALETVAVALLVVGAGLVVAGLGSGLAGAGCGVLASAVAAGLASYGLQLVHREDDEEGAAGEPGQTAP
jgi:high-affinity Fe2+/Pb2+ permease